MPPFQNFFVDYLTRYIIAQAPCSRQEVCVVFSNSTNGMTVSLYIMTTKYRNKKGKDCLLGCIEPVGAKNSVFSGVLTPRISDYYLQFRCKFLCKNFFSHPPPPLPIGKGENFLISFAGRLCPLHPAAGIKCFAYSREFAEIPRLPMPFKFRCNFFPKFQIGCFTLNFGGAKEWGCGGRNFGAPDGSAPTKE